MATVWINFKKLREELDFKEVLKSYDVQAKDKNGKAQCFCPLPGHRGQKKSPSFSMNFAKGIFQCFGCGARGNVLDFVCLMEGLNPRRGSDVHKVAIDLQEKFLGTGAKREDRSERKPRRRRNDENEDSPPQRNLPVIVNAPLDFELQSLDYEHTYLPDRGFTKETIDHFGLGFCNRGSMKGRIAIPLHDPAGKLIGYAGRLTDENALSDTNPKYKLPAAREHEGKLYEFHKSAFLYNGHAFKEPVKKLVVVEGFTHVWWLWQCGFKTVVAIMGSDLSPVQAKLILKLVQPKGRVWVMPDGNEAGRRCAESVMRQVSPHRFVRWVKLTDDRQPTDVTAENLHELLGARKSGTSEKPHVADPVTDSNVKADQPTAAEA